MWLLNNIKSNPVAWYGAIIATLNIIFSLLKYLRDRPRIKLEIKKNQRILNGPYDENKTYVVVNVINKGRRPINIGVAEGKFVNGKSFILTDSWAGNTPRILDEKNPRTFFAIEQSSIQDNEIYYVLVRDNTDRVFKMYLKPWYKRIFQKRVKS